MPKRYALDAVLEDIARDEESSTRKNTHASQTEITARFQNKAPKKRRVVTPTDAPTTTNGETSASPTPPSP